MSASVVWYGFRIVRAGSARVAPVRGRFASIAEARAAGERVAGPRDSVRVVSL